MMRGTRRSTLAQALGALTDKECKARPISAGPYHPQEKLMKSQVSLFRAVAFISISIFSLMCAYKLGKDQSRKDPWRPSAPPHPRMALGVGQTIIGVAEMANVLRFYLGTDARDAHEEG